MPTVERPNQFSVLIVDDDEGLRKVLSSEIKRMGYNVDAVGAVAAARNAVADGDYDVILLDLRLPRISGEQYLEELRRETPWSQVIVLTGHANVDVAIDCMKKGAYDFLTKPCPLDQLEALLEKASEKSRLLNRCDSLQRIGTQGAGIGQSRGFRQVQEVIERVAPSDESVLITGESGTGKELLAQEIFRRSRRSHGPFITVNCSAFSQSLLESELFGHERGSFTGAESRRIGVFQLADRGTIFLDEIGDMPLTMQAKLLRALQSGEIRPVGGQRNLYVDVRVVSATNHDLALMVEEGSFRSDLFYRINTFTVELPPLRERGEDIEVLAQHFLAEYSRRVERSMDFAPEALEVLNGYSWPGNIRELGNVVKRAAILTSGDTVRPEDLRQLVNPPEDLRNGQIDVTDYRADELEKIQLIKMIEVSGGNKREAARRLGISNKTLYNKLHSYGIELDSIKPSS